MSKRGRLFLIPNVIAVHTQHQVIPSSVLESLKGIQHFLVEDIRTARRYLSSLKIYESIEPLHFEVLNKTTKASELQVLLAPLLNGENVGVISESGCPGVADPGALAVSFAHQNEIDVVPLVGPSSILLALMASGLNGQRFAFQGYLPVNKAECSVAIKQFEKDSRAKNQTQIFIETPYRNNQLFQNLIKTLQPETLLCTAIDVSGAQEKIKTRVVKDWRKSAPELPKVPAVFLFLAS
jgi:16S rRNA (cytidine1402-2'-O)-methyltransferase